MKVSTVIHYVYLLVMVFLFTTEIPLLLGVTTRRLAMTIAIVVLVWKQKHVRDIFAYIDHQKLFSFFIFIMFVSIISLSHFYSRTSNMGTYTEPWFFLYIILYVFIFSIYCAVEFKSLKEFAFLIVCVHLFQTAIVLRGVVDSSFRLYIYENFYFDDDRFTKTINSGTRFMGINLAGASGSIKLCTAALSLIILRVTNSIKAIPFWSFYTIIMIGTLFVGRTGVLVEIALIMYVIYSGKGKLSSIVYVLLFTFLLLNSIIIILSLLDPTISDIILDWMTASFSANERDAVNDSILKGGIPPFSFDFILGTGMSTGYRVNGISYYSDSGLIRTYMEYGIIGFICYYYSIYNLLTSPKVNKLNKNLKRLFSICIAVVFIIEYKEPFIMKYVFPWSILTCMLLCIKDNRTTHNLAR